MIHKPSEASTQDDISFSSLYSPSKINPQEGEPPENPAFVFKAHTGLGLRVGFRVVLCFGARALAAIACGPAIVRALTLYAKPQNPKVL